MRKYNRNILADYLKLSDEEKEILSLKRKLREKTKLATLNQSKCLQFEYKARILSRSLKAITEERDELKESLCELDPNFGDIISLSDRGYEMRYE